MDHTFKESGSSKGQNLKFIKKYVIKSKICCFENDLIHIECKIFGGAVAPLYKPLVQLQAT